MIWSKKVFWFTFAFCVTTGSCKEFFKNIGEEVKLDCEGLDMNLEFEWKLDNKLVIQKFKTGRLRKGFSDNRVRLDGSVLRISTLKSTDAGEYRCQSLNHKTVTHTLYVMSAHASPSSVLHCSETKLSCNVGNFNGIVEWLNPESKVFMSGKNVIVKSVSSYMAGVWACSVKKNDRTEVLKINVTVTVVGPLNTTKEVAADEGNDVELPCFLPAASTKTITGGSWTYITTSPVSLLKLVNEQNAIKWHKISTKNMSFSNHGLNPNFNVTLKKVKVNDSGAYECKLDFEDGQSLSARLDLMVKKKSGDYSGSTDSKVPNPKQKLMLDVHQWWVWVVVVLALLVLIVLVIIIVLIHRMNKRKKRKMKKMKSMRQTITSRNYCKCDRSVRQPRTGKKERPPPLPRHHYTSLNKL